MTTCAVPLDATLSLNSSQAPVLTSNLCQGLCSSSITKFLHSRMTCLLYPVSAFGSVLGIMDIQRAKQISQCPTGILAHKEIKFCISDKHQMLRYSNSKESMGEETRPRELRSECLGRLSRSGTWSSGASRRDCGCRALQQEVPAELRGHVARQRERRVRMTFFRTSGAIETFLASILNEGDIVFNRENDMIWAAFHPIAFLEETLYGAEGERTADGPEWLGCT